MLRAQVNAPVFNVEIHMEDGLHQQPLLPSERDHHMHTKDCFRAIKKFALQRKEMLKPGKWTVLENFILALIQKDLEVSSPEDMFTYYNLSVQQASDILESNVDNLCPRSIKSLSAKMMSVASKSNLSIMDLYFRLLRFKDEDC